MLSKLLRYLFPKPDPDDFMPDDCTICGGPIDGPLGPDRTRQVQQGAHDECIAMSDQASRQD
jgi:hypothetical protein